MTRLEYLDKLKERGISYMTTGSRAWGVDSGVLSDHDIIIEHDNLDVCTQVATDHNINVVNSEYNNGKYIHTSDIMVNIIPLIPIELITWIYATLILKSICNEDRHVKNKIKRNRNERYSRFKSLTAAIYHIYMGDATNYQSSVLLHKHCDWAGEERIRQIW